MNGISSDVMYNKGSSLFTIALHNEVLCVIIGGGIFYNNNVPAINASTEIFLG